MVKMCNFRSIFSHLWAITVELQPVFCTIKWTWSGAWVTKVLSWAHTHQPGKVLATCSDSLCLLPKTSYELSVGSTRSSLLFLALLECCSSALLLCLRSLYFGHVRKLVFGLAALSQDNNLPLRPVTCCWTVVEKTSNDKVNNKLTGGHF